MRIPFVALSLALTSFCPSVTQAQEPVLGQVRPLVVASEPNVVPNSYIVEFATRSFTLDRYREAIYANRPAEEVERIVADLDASVLADQAAFVAAVKALGGTVENQWWIVNAACVTVPPAQLAALTALPNVARVTNNRLYTAVYNDARNAAHHNSAAANLKKDAANQFVRGKGLSVAVLDTGVDALMGSSGRPHRAFFPGGNPANTTGGGISGSNMKAVYGTSGFGTEDANGHGTFCSGCVGANLFPLSADGMAPDAWIVGVKISDNTGSAAGNWLISGWQQVASVKATHNIRVANNSFSGSPDLNDPIQQSLDSVAFNSDILVAVASGNNGPNNTTASQSAFNGLAVGSLNKNSLANSSYTSCGYLSGYGTGRTYPDIAAVGASVNSVLLDSESQYSNGSGTSFASPMVAGIGALVRQAGGAAMTAIQAKAVILNNTNNESSETGSVNTTYRNQKGCGVVRADFAVDAALAGDFQTATLTNASKIRNWTFGATASVRKNVTIAWMRGTNLTAYNVDLRIYDANNVLVASDLMQWNSYAKCSWVPTTTGQYRAEATWVVLNATSNLDVAISGAGKPSSGPPTLGSIAPQTAKNYSAAAQPLTLTGTNLDTVTQVSVGGTSVPFSIQSQTSIVFNLPVPFGIAAHNVTVTNGSGTSGPVTLTVSGTHPAVYTTPALALRGYPSSNKFYSDKNWGVVLLVSLSNVPSSLPGILNLGIGNNFTDLTQVTVLSCDTKGYVDYSLLYPTGIPSTVLYFQGIPFDPANPFASPLESSNAIGVTLF